MRAVVLFLLLAAPAFADGDASCAGCHPDVAREWQKSLHRRAWTDPVFQQALKVEPLPFCRGCHAPNSDPAHDPSPRAADVGVSCTSCHVDSAGNVTGPRVNQRATHPVFVDSRLSTKAACARCHQFDFPEHSGQRTPQPMQDTLEEHALSAYADTPCQSCHMPIVDGEDGRHRSHDFGVIANPALLRRAVTVRAERLSDGIRLSLSANEIGHAFPTGDMFRRLEVRAQAVSANGQVTARATPVILARSFADRPRDPDSLVDVGVMRVEVADTRVPPRGVRVVEMPIFSSGKIRYQVVYQRMSSPMADAFGVQQALDEIVVAEGELP